MNRETSIYLDLVRLLAAVLVFLSHASRAHSSGGLLWQLEGHGREAVDVFFVLSGFVIAFAIDGRETTPLTYAVNRAARLYSVALPALAATFLLDMIGRSIQPALYLGWCCDVAGSTGWQFFGSALFLNEVWSHHTPPGSDVPYWSLGFEAFYYLAFGLAWFLNRPWNLVAAAAVLIFAGPGIAVLFPLWLLGFGCYRLCARQPLDSRLGIALFVATLAGLVAAACWGSRQGEIYDAFALDPGRLWDYGQDYLIGGLFALNLLAFRAMSTHFPGALDGVAPPLRWLAGATFTLYLFHQPLIHVLVALAPWPESSWQTRSLVFVAVPFIVLLIAEVTERRRNAWRQAILALPWIGSLAVNRR